MPVLVGLLSELIYAGLKVVGVECGEWLEGKDAVLDLSGVVLGLHHPFIALSPHDVITKDAVLVGQAHQFVH